MIVTEAALREQLRHPRNGARVDVPTGAVLSPSARDFVAQWDLDLHETGSPAGGGHPAWDRPSTFTHDGSAAPLCATCGGAVADKPDHLTQLDSSHLAPKTHPRIRLRGRLDTLQATVLLAGRRARDLDAPTTADHLDQLAAYVRELLAAEYQARPAAALAIGGLDEAALHAATHDPRTAFGGDHLTPASTDAEVLLWCNQVRALSREVELAVLDAHPDPHDPVGASLLHGANRLSSAAYWIALSHAARAPHEEVLT